jgi:hypothetical protein
VEFDLAESRYDTVKLYRWLKVVSASRNIGTNDAMILYNQEVKLCEMHALTQVHQSIAEFSLEFTRLNGSSVSVGCPVLPPALLAHQFVSKLKPSFDKWRLDMHNNALMGVAGAFPPNVDEAARIAANYHMGNDDRDINH